MKAWNLRIALAAVAALLVAPMFAGAVHANTTCEEEYADSPASSHCNVDRINNRKTGEDESLCLIFAPSCSVSFTYGAEGSDGTRPTYDLDVPLSGMGIYKRYLSSTEICISDSTEAGGSASFEVDVTTSGCDEDEHTASEAIGGAFHED